MQRESVRATWSNVLWSSLRTITRQLPPRPEPGPLVRGFSIVWLMRARVPSARPDSAAVLVRPALETEEQVVGRRGLQDRLGGVARLGPHALPDALDEPLRVTAALVEQRPLR